MAATVAEKYEEMTLGVETETPGTYANICGLKGVTISRVAQVDSFEVPADCTDESLPYSTEKEVRSLTVTVDASDAVWAQSSHEMLMDWYYSGQSKNIRLGHTKAAVGDTEYESGAALLTKMDDARTKGQRVSRSISLEFVRTPTRTAKSA